MDAELLKISEDFWNTVSFEVDSEDELISVGDMVLYTPYYLLSKKRQLSLKYNETSSPNHVMFWQDFKILNSASKRQATSLTNGVMAAMNWSQNPVGFLVISPDVHSPERFRLGKSALAKAIHTELLLRNIPCVFWSVPAIVQAWYTNGGSLTEKQRDGMKLFRKDVKEALVQIAATAQVLVLDDYSAYYKTNYADSFLESLLISRSDDDSRGTVITTSDNIDSLKDDYPLMYSRISTGKRISLFTEQYPIALAAGSFVIGSVL